MKNKSTRRLGDLLLDAGLITKDQLDRVLLIQRRTNRRIGEIVVDEGLAEERDILELLKAQIGIERVELEKLTIDPEIPKLITESMARRYNLIPIRLEGGRIIVAMDDPLNILAMDDVRIATGMEVEAVIATRAEIVDAIDQFYRQQNTEQAIEEFKRQYQDDLAPVDQMDEESMMKVNSAPMVRFIDSLIKQAISSKASDIHIEPFEKNVRIRFRVDGDLQEVITPERTSHSAIVTRIKIMGKMDIAEKRVPQDGRVNHIIDGRSVDMRVSTLPTAFGEKAVIRLLDTGGTTLTKEQLGFTPHNMRAFEKLIQYPYGIILVTGPTGSGKTTTLYAILNELNKMSRNIVTVEDPIEYRMNGINQVQVNPKAGLTFAAGLRSILRQDPDVIMIGEIRDTETAHIAVRAAITGHLVLATIHTNDTASTVARLVDMEIEPYLISGALVGIQAQRLLKKICKECKISYLASDEEKRNMGEPLDQELILHKGAGCPVCNGTGYKGRTSVVEIMQVNLEIKELINRHATTEELRQCAGKNGMISLRQNAIELVKQGTTTYDEMLRSTYTLD